MVFEEFAAGCARGGLDLARPLRVGWYNEVIDAAYRLPDFGSPASLAVVVGNSRAMWPRFKAALAADPALAADANPLERYVVGVVERALAPLAVAHEARYAHERPPRLVAIQRLAHAAGLAFLGPANLVVHPVHGPWISLRAAVVFAVPGPDGPPAAPVDTCAGCARPCVAALERAVAAAAGATPGRVVADHWRDWLAVRDACPVGVTSRYQEDHIRYGYARDRAALR